jgi:Uma2 family endonuclease
MVTVPCESADPLSESGEPEYLYEVVDGRIVEKATGAYECWFASVLFGILNSNAFSKRLGRVFRAVMFDLRPHVGRERRPDVAFVSYERWARDRHLPRSRSWVVIPDLAIELVSRTLLVEDAADKLEEYFKVGVRQVWVVYPVHAKIYIYTSTSSVRILTVADELDGGDVLPGFRVSVRDLFNEAGEPA